MSDDVTTSNTTAREARFNRLAFFLALAALAIAAVAILFAGEGLFRTGDRNATDGQRTAARLPSSGPAPGVGDTALAFEVQNVDGETVRLSDHLGQPVILNFWASWCAPCRVEMPALQALYEEHEDQGLVILALNQNESEQTAERFFFQEMGLTFAVPLLDEQFGVAEKYGVRNLPTTIFIDEAGTVTAIHRGPAVQSQFEEMLAQTLR